MLFEIFLAWVVETALDSAHTNAFSVRDEQVVLKRSLEIVRRQLPDEPDIDVLVEALGVHLGGRKPRWYDPNASLGASPASLREALRWQLAPIELGTLARGRRTAASGEELLAGLGLDVDALVDLIEPALLEAVQVVAAERGGLPERLRQRDASRQNSMLEQISERLQPPESPESAGPTMDELIRDKTDFFTGRRYVFEAIEEFMDTHDRGFFIVEGDPGAGKTSILAEYVRRSGCVAHFNIRSQSINKTAQLLSHLSEQLAERYGISSPASSLKATEYGLALNRLLVDAREALPARRPLIIAIDALDEVDTTGDADGANVLVLPASPPTGVYFLLTRRRASVALHTAAPVQVYDLGRHLRETMSDIQEYLRRQAGLERINAWLIERTITQEQFVAVLADKSEGNFMYLRHVLPELTTEHYRSLELEALPQGLQSYYDSHWRLMGMTADPLPRTQLWVLYVLCELGRPVSSQFITEVLRRVIAGTEILVVQAVLDNWWQFLHREPMADGPRFSIYHGSFQDFLYRKDIVAGAGLSLPGVNDVIADLLWEVEFGAGGGDYDH